MKNKKQYQTPKLIVHGDVAQLTHGKSSGKKLDASFPVNADFDTLTFS